MRSLSKLTPESAYGQIKALISSAPADIYKTQTTPETQQWVGRVAALIKDTLGAVGTINLTTCRNHLRSDIFGPAAANQIMGLLYEAVAVVELELPAGAQGAFIPAGSTFDAMAAVSKIFSSSTKDLLVVDPYFDEKILTEFAQFACEGIAIRLLGDEAGVKGTLNPAVKSWHNQFGNKRPLSVRLAPPRSLHDRLIFIDHAQVWTVGQSFNALAARAPTSFNKSDDDTAALKLRAFGDISDAAKPT